MDSRPLPESRFHAESDTLDRRLRRNGMLQVVASMGYMKSRPNPRPRNCHRCRWFHIASQDPDKMPNPGSVEDETGKGKLGQSRARERSGRGGSCGRGLRVLT